MDELNELLWLKKKKLNFTIVSIIGHIEHAFVVWFTEIIRTYERQNVTPGESWRKQQLYVRLVLVCCLLVQKLWGHLLQASN